MSILLYLHSKFLGEGQEFILDAHRKYMEKKI